MRRYLALGCAAAAAMAVACGGKDASGPPPVTTPTQLSMSLQPSASAQNAVALPQPPQVRLRDAAGHLSATAGVLVTATVNNGAAVTNATATTDANGAATFTGLTITGLVGSYTLHFAATGLTGVDAAAITLTAGHASQLAIVTAPSTSAQAGTALAVQPAVQLQDISGNAVAQANISVTAALVSGAVAVSNATAATNSSGLATFSGLTLAGTAGTYTFNFSATGLASAVAPAATVLAAGAATQLSLSTQPSSSVSNGAVLGTQPVVQVRDAYGNNAPKSGATVVATVVAGPAGSTIVGDTAITDATGKATFTALAITGLVGSYSIRFASAPLASAVSSGIALTAGAAARFNVVTAPSSSVQNATAFATQPIIQLVDQSSNSVATPGLVVTAAVTGASVANATANTDNTGKATFSGLSVTGVTGSYRVKFSVPSLPVDSSSITTITAGAAAGLKVQTAPGASQVNNVALGTQPAVRLVDVSGNNVSQSGVVITATVVSGSVTLTNAAATTAATGIATFSGLALTGPVGSYTFRFTSSGLTSVDAAAPTSLTPGAATQLALLTQPPAAGQSGIALSPPAVVQLQDISGNAVSQSGVSVSAAVIGGGASVSGASATTNASGQASFGSLAITGTAGAYSLRFTSGVLASVDAAGSTTLGAGAAAQLALSTQPGTAAQSGIAMGTQPVVQLQDGAGNPVSQAGVLVTASVVSGSVTLANNTATTTAGGTATFANLSITGTIGSYTLKFTATGLAAATAAAPTVLSAGAAAKLGLVTQPSTTAQSGIALATQPVVQVQDANGNAVAASGLLVTASVLSGTATFTNQTATTNASGTATFAGFAISALTGSYTFNFTASGLANISAASATSVSPGNAAVLTLTTQPSTTGVVAVALPTQPAVQLRDAAGNAVAASGVQVTASVVSGSVTFANATATTNASGVATFSGLSMAALVGSYTLRFGASGLTPVNAASATALSVGAAAQLSVTTQPSTSAVNDVALATQPVVQLRDAGGNAVSSSGVIITAAASGATVLQATATTAGSGAATFSGLTLLGLVGNYTLSFSGTGLQAANAAAATALAAGAVQSLVIITNPPSTAQSGVALSVSPVIEARDTSDNPVSGVGVVAEAPVTQGSSAHVNLTNASQSTGVNGRATFAGLTLTGTATGYSIRFCDGPCAGTSIIVGSTVPTSLMVGTAAAITVTTQPATAATNGTALATQPAVNVTDAGGNPVASATVNVTTSAGVIVTGGTAITDAAGDATFSSVTLTGTASSYTLQFGTGAASTAASAPTILSAGAPTGITINTAPPTSAKSGIVFGSVPAVTVTDANGNPVGNYTVTTTVSPGATVNASSATTNASGVATFTGMGLVGSVNTYTLTFHAGSATASPAAISLTSGSAAHIAITGGTIAASASNGTPLSVQPQVTVTDGSSNPVANAIVTASLTTAGASVLNASATTNGSGVATFSGLTLVGTTATTYTLQFTSGSITQVAGSTTSLAVGAPSQLLISTQPSTSARSGIALATQPVVQVADAGGALITTDNGRVVTASVLSGSAVIGSGTATTAGGIATFSGLKLSALAGSYTLVFSAPSATAVTAAAPTSITAGIAAGLVVSTQPSNSGISDTILAVQPVIQVRDGAGNPVDTSGITVTMGVTHSDSVNKSPVLTGTLSQVTDGLGHATFSGVAVRPAGSYRLQFAAPTLAVTTPVDSLVIGTLLADSAPDSNLTGSVNTAQSLVIKVLPSDTLLTISISGPNTPGSGDADLYVRYGAAPDIAHGIHDCFPNLSGNNEVCTFHNPTPGLWYASVFAFFSYSGVTLTATASGHP